MQTLEYKAYIKSPEWKAKCEERKIPLTIKKNEVV